MRKDEIAHAGEIHFIKKDSDEETVVKAEILLPLLTKERLTTRGKWGIKVLRDHPKELAIEPGKSGTWKFLPVEWYPSRVTAQYPTEIVHSPSHGLNSSKDDLLRLVAQLKRCYPQPEFPLESHIYARDRERRDPYKVLILFLLSVGTRDEILVPVCGNFFDKFPRIGNLMNATYSAILNTVRGVGLHNKKLEFIKSAIEVIRNNGNRVPDDPDRLRKIDGIGGKLLECVPGYGFGKPSLPVDSNVMRVLHRVAYGQDAPRLTSSDYDSVRGKLKGMLEESDWIDTHEILRLHGMSICRKAYPQCKLCLIESCRYRKAAPLDESKAMSGARWEAKRVLNNEWEPWRRLICDP